MHPPAPLIHTLVRAARWCVHFAAAIALPAAAQAPAKPSVAAVRPALTVTTARPQSVDLPVRLSANGSIAAWQEALLGAEINGLRLAEVRADVGDAVKKGQVLAVLAAEAIEADVAQARAALAQAEAAVAETRADADRARAVQGTGALSDQQIVQMITAEKTAAARLAVQRAALDQQLLRLKYTRIVASDNGVISARSATLGAVVAQGQELFRLIRQSRLEWRAEVPAADLAQLRTGQAVTVRVRASGTVGDISQRGRVRVIAPAVDAQTRNAIVYVDLPGALAAGLRPGMFASGEFHLGSRPALTLPQAALVARDGFNYVFVLGSGNRVVQTKVQTGRREGDRFEVLSGIEAGQTLVAAGAAFLADGDTVRVNDTAAPAAKP